MKSIKRGIAFALSLLLLLSALPMVLAEETETATTLRLEAENYVASLSTTTAASVATSAAADTEQASGGKFLNNCRLNDVICLGEVDLTGLTSVTVSIATNAIQSGFAFSIDGTDKVIAAVNNSASGGWTTFEEYTASVSASASDLVGTHILYVTVASSSNNVHGGNFDYVELIKTTPVVEETTTEIRFLDLNAALSSGNYVKEAANIGSTKADTVLAYSNVVLDELSAITINHAPFNNTNITVDILCGDTYDTATLLMSCDLTETLIGAGQWYGTDNYRDEKFAVPENAKLSGTTNLFFHLNTTNNYGGNYKTFTLHYGSSTVIKSEKAMNFADDIDTGLSTTPYNVNKTSHIVESTNVGTVLAYPNIQWDGLNGISIHFAPTNLKMEVYRGNTMADATLIATPTLDSTLLSGATNWYDEANYRTSDVFPLSLDNTTGSTLFFKLTGGRGNFKNFTLHYAESIDEALGDICELDATAYVWGATNTTSNWIRDNSALNSPNNGDIFYLGKAALSDLTYISVSQANANATSEITFYADLNVNFDALTKNTAGTNNDNNAEDHDRYQYTTDNDPFSDGIEIGKVALGKTTDWLTYSSFFTVVDDETRATLGDTKHDIYMKVTSSGNAGNIDYIRFNGLSKADFDTTSNWPQGELDVAFVGQFKEEVYTATVTSADELATLLTTVKAPALGGYTFVGWNESVDNAAVIFDTNKDLGLVYEIEPVYSTGDNEGKRLQYNVTVGANIASTNCTIDGGIIADAYFDSRIELTLADGVEGTVDYWVLDGQKLAYGKSNFTFFVAGTSEVSVVLVDGEASTPEASVAIQQYATQYNEYSNTYVLSIIAQTYVPTGNATEFGVYYSFAADELQKVKDKDATAAFVKIISSKTGNNQQYMAHLLEVKAERTRYAMAYAVIDGTTVYSNQVVCFATKDDGTVTVTVTRTEQTDEPTDEPIDDEGGIGSGDRVDDEF